MSARRKRAASPKRAKSVPRGQKRRRRTPAAALDTLPMSPATIRRISLGFSLFIALALGLAVLVALEVPRLVGTQLGEAAGRAGFVVRHVEVKGLERMDELPVYAIALAQESRALPLVDIDRIRETLLRDGWVREARVTRRYPDTLVVEITEREPAAVWQHREQLSIVDRQGVVLDEVALDDMPDLPILVGPGANRKAAALDALLDAAPSLRPIVASATWIGGRRWDLRFQSGETLALPEGEAAPMALERFAVMDRSAGLLGRNFARFDMRFFPKKMIVRVSSQPGSSVSMSHSAKSI
ncbi:MAG: cell division protein FtsQ/DivIB [Sphingomonadaceae bacterium]